MNIGHVDVASEAKCLIGEAMVTKSCPFAFFSQQVKPFLFKVSSCCLQTLLPPRPATVNNNNNNNNNNSISSMPCLFLPRTLPHPREGHIAVTGAGGQTSRTPPHSTRPASCMASPTGGGRGRREGPLPPMRLGRGNLSL